MRLIDADELIHLYFDDENGKPVFDFVPWEFVENAPTIEFISTDCVNVNKVVEAACDIWKDNDGDTAMQTLIDWLKEYAPRVIAVPLKHGRWLYKELRFKGDKTPTDYTYECSACGYKWGEDIYHYCPNCGAKMDLDEVEE